MDIISNVKSRAKAELAPLTLRDTAEYLTLPPCPDNLVIGFRESKFRNIADSIIEKWMDGLSYYYSAGSVLAGTASS